MSWKILDTGLASAERNMTIDYDLLRQLPSTKDPILHLYDWEEKSATYGYFSRPYELLRKEGVRQHGLQIARRPTGGGLLFHMTDFAFSILIPAHHPAFSFNTLENYAYVNRIVAETIGSFLGNPSTPGMALLQVEPAPMDEACRHFCMAKPTTYDVMFNGCKLAGGAQRKTKYGFLHQGTIALAMPDENLLKDLLVPGTCVIEVMSHLSYPLAHDVKVARREMRALLIDATKKQEEKYETSGRYTTQHSRQESPVAETPR